MQIPVWGLRCLIQISWLGIKLISYNEYRMKIISTREHANLSDSFQLIQMTSCLFFSWIRRLFFSQKLWFSTRNVFWFLNAWKLSNGMIDNDTDVPPTSTTTLSFVLIEKFLSKIIKWKTPAWPRNETIGMWSCLNRLWENKTKSNKV